MKNPKKLFALLLSVLLILTAALPVFADEVKPAITVTNAISGETYNAYMILKLEKSTAEVGTKGQEGYVPAMYFYTIADGWKDFFIGESAPAKSYVTLVGDYVYPSDTFTEDRAAEFAALAKTYVGKKTIAASKTAVAAAEADSVKLEVGVLGYYLVDSTLGAVCSLTTVNPTAEVHEKNELPTIEKKAGTLDYAVSQVGKTIDFTVTVTPVAGYTNYVIEDTMTGLTYVSNSAKKGGNKISEGISYSNGVLKITLGDITGAVTVTYSAVVTADAVTEGKNTAKLKFDYGQKKLSSEDVLKVYTWEVEVFKYTQTTAKPKYPLADAKFGIYTDKDCSNKLYVVSSGENAVRPMTEEEIEEAQSKDNTFITGVSGKFKIVGLGDGTYYLKEEQAPSGYNPLTAPVAFTISSEKSGETVTMSLKVGENTATGIEIENAASGAPLLPETGGAGTVAFVLTGCVVFIGTAVILVTKKRMYNEG